MMSSSPDAPLVPVRMLNEYTYCPRLAFLEWVQAEWASNADTDEGELVHRLVDEQKGELTDGIEEGRVQSLHLSDEELGLTARLDLVEAKDGVVAPIDFKRGRAPDVPEGAWLPERVQVCAQGLLLRAHGHRCDHGYLYFAASRKRVRVEFDDETLAATRAALEGLRKLADGGPMPPPLLDSPKCARCSLVAICQPDEVNALNDGNAGDGGAGEVRRLTPARDDALPVYVLGRGHKVGVSGQELVIRDDEEVVRRRLIDSSQLCIFGNASVSAPCIQRLCERDIPILWFSYGGWFYGVTRGMATKNVHLRIAQHALASSERGALVLAKRFVRTKIRNQRTLLRRNHRGAPTTELSAMQTLARKSQRAPDNATLLGVEGAAARNYFGAFAGMLGDAAMAEGFEFSGRNRRPARDRVNALLSFAYALLAKDWTITLYSVGFDPFVGFFHRPRHGRPALALDLMEEFRPLVADSVVLSAINNGVVRSEDFIVRGPSMALKPAGKKAFLKAYERRMSEEIRHPTFGYRISYRRVFEVQARLLGRYLEGEIDEYPAFETR